MAGMVLSSIYNNVWKVLQLLSADPSPLVTDMARKLVSRVKQKVSTVYDMSTLSVFIFYLIQYSELSIDIFKHYLKTFSALETK